MTKDPTAGWLPPPSRRHRIVATAFAFAFLLAYLAVRTHLVNPFPAV
jgi:hypothetical protein